MKKYISIVSLAVALGMQSCDRAHDTDETPEKVQQKSERQYSQRTTDSTSPPQEHEGYDSKDTGDDDEPRKDKQHWRVVNDSI